MTLFSLWIFKARDDNLKVEQERAGKHKQRKYGDEEWVQRSVSDESPVIGRSKQPHVTCPHHCSQHSFS